jgi:hypothetical protein
VYLNVLKRTMDTYHATSWSSDPFRLSSSEEEEIHYSDQSIKNNLLKNVIVRNGNFRVLLAFLSQDFQTRLEHPRLAECA